MPRAKKTKPEPPSKHVDADVALKLTKLVGALKELVGAVEELYEVIHADLDKPSNP